MPVTRNCQCLKLNSQHSGYSPLQGQRGSCHLSADGETISNSADLRGPYPDLPSLLPQKQVAGQSWLSCKVPLTVPHLGCGLEHRCQGQLPQKARLGFLQLSDAWGRKSRVREGGTVALSVPKTLNGKCLMPTCAHYAPAAYPAGLAAAASTGPTARPRLHWNAGAPHPDPEPVGVPLLLALLVVGTGKEGTAGEMVTGWSGALPMASWQGPPP